MITLHPAGKKDARAIAVLLQELEAYYGGPPPDPERLAADEAQIIAVLFGDTPAAFVLLARTSTGDGGEERAANERDADAVGLATYSFLWPAAGVTKSLFLKELYIRRSHRRRGVGTLLMDAIRERAEHERCSRVEWMTERDNDEARAFYRHLGFTMNDAKVPYRIELDPERA